MFLRLVFFLLIPFIFSACGGSSESSTDNPALNPEEGNTSDAPKVDTPDEEISDNTDPVVEIPIDDPHDPINYSWSSPDFAESEGGDVSVPSIDINNRGDSVITWAQKEGTGVNVNVIYLNANGSEIVSRLNPENSKTKVENPNYVSFSNPHTIAKINESGEAFAAWTSSLIEESYMNTVNVATFNQTTNSWGLPLKISNITTDIYDPLDMALNDNGDAVIVWSQKSDKSKKLFLSQYSSSNKIWSSPIVLSTGNIYSPKVVLTSNGNSIIAFSESSEELNSTNLYSIQVNASGDISTKHRIDSQQSSISGFTININSNDQVVASWLQKDSKEQTDPWVSSHQSNTWTVATKIDSTFGNSTAPVTTVLNEEWDILIAWVDGSNSTHVYRDLYTTVLSNDLSINEYEVIQDGWSRVPDISNTGDGEVLLAWGTAALKSFKNGEWSSDGFSSGYYARPGIKIASAKNGKAIASWVNSEGGSQNLLYSLRY